MEMKTVSCDTAEELLKELRLLTSPAFGYVVFKFKDKHFPKMKISRFFFLLRKLEKAKYLEVYLQTTGEGAICSHFSLVWDGGCLGSDRKIS